VTATATAGSVTPASFALTAQPGPVATVAILAGSGQTAFVRTLLPVAVKFATRDQYGNAVPATPVTMSVVSGGGSLSATSVTTDAAAEGSVSWTLGGSLGTQTIRAAATATATANITATANTPYQVEAIYSSRVPATVRPVMDAAIERWKRIITTDLGAVNFSTFSGSCDGNIIPQGTTVTGLRIYVDVALLSSFSTYANASPCYSNSASQLSVVGAIRINDPHLNTLLSNGMLLPVLVHEIGHVLGFSGLNWQTRGLLANAGTSDPYFTGANARAAFTGGFGSSYGGNAVPIEAGGGEGTAGSHWRKSVFNSEIMTGFVSPGMTPLSLVTVEALRDVGHFADVAGADAFSGAQMGARGARLPGAPMIYIGDDFIPNRPIPVPAVPRR